MKVAVYASAFLAALECVYSQKHVTKLAKVTLTGNAGCYEQRSIHSGPVGGVLRTGSQLTVSCRLGGDEVLTGPSGPSRWWYFTEFGCWINGGYFYGDDVTGPC